MIRARLLAALLLASPALLAQGRGPFLAVPKFRGSVTYDYTFAGITDMGANVKVTASASASFVVERVSGSTPTWQGRFTTSTSNISLDARSGYGNCEETESFTIVGPLQPGESGLDARIQLRADSWSFNLSGFRGPSQTSTITTVCTNPPSTRKTELRAGLYMPSWIYDLPYPAGGGTRISHSGTVESDGDFSTYHSHQISLIQWRYTLSLEPDADDLKLEISSDQYDKWRPTAKKDGSPGDPIEFTARLIRKASGEEAPQDVRTFEWELIDTSQEPGIAMNWPQDATDSDFDMRFLPQGDQVPASEYKQKLLRPVRDTATDKAKVEPIDWGGWATMRVTVELLDGRKIVGEYKGTGDKDIRLPKRRAGSLIADSFREDKDAQGDDSSDEEKKPEGDPNGAGDGLTLYQEYRGFYEDGDHIEGDTKVKDYFAQILSGSGVDAGLLQFQKATGLKVHYKLGPAELAADRVINGNRQSGPHRVKQHGVTYLNAGYQGFAKANGGPGTPKSITFVGLPSSLPARPTADPQVSYTAATVAHEALHTVNVWHHGEADETVTWTGVNGVLKENGANITVFNEAGANITAVWSRTLDGKDDSWELGMKSGQHSGVEDCLMRYDVANAYVKQGDASARYALSSSETPGTSLCDQSEGTGVNNPSRTTPQPRYFDAAAGRGNCKSQILVNDAIAAPKR